MKSFFRRLGWLAQRSRKEAELREELQFHLEEEAEQHQGEGLAEEQARWAARRELGNLTLVQEDTRANCEMIKGCPRTRFGSVCTSCIESALQGRTSSLAEGILRTSGNNFPLGPD